MLTSSLFFFPHFVVQALRVNPALVDVHNNLGDLWRAQVRAQAHVMQWRVCRMHFLGWLEALHDADRLPLISHSACRCVRTSSSVLIEFRVCYALCFAVC